MDPARRCFPNWSRSCLAEGRINSIRKRYENEHENDVLFAYEIGFPMGLTVVLILMLMLTDAAADFDSDVDGDDDADDDK